MAHQEHRILLTFDAQELGKPAGFAARTGVLSISVRRCQARWPAAPRVGSGTQSREITRAFTLSRTTERSLHRMARRPNYDFEKRRKEQERLARTVAKRADRQQRRQERQAEEAPAPARPAPDEEQSGTVPPAV